MTFPHFNLRKDVLTAIDVLEGRLRGERVTREQLIRVREIIRSHQQAEASEASHVPTPLVAPIPEPVAKHGEEYRVDPQIAEFVARGIQASEEIAARQFTADRRWVILENEIPAEDLTVDTLALVTTRRIRRMLRSLASEARENKLEARPLSERFSWCIDVQYEIIERLPVRPDETSSFLQALLADMLQAARAGKRVGGAWGEVRVYGASDLILTVTPVQETDAEGIASARSTRFTRLRRERT